MKMFHSLRVFILFILCEQITSSAIPIWELLSHQEKIGQLMYLFLNLVDVYCKNSPIPDCEKVLTLYGTSNLINQREDVLDLMDPYQRNGREILWSHVMDVAFELPSEMRSLPFATNPHAELEDGLNNIGDYDINFPDYSEYHDTAAASGDPHPYAVSVPAPISGVQDQPQLSHHQEPSNIEQVVSPQSQNIVSQSGVSTSVANFNHQKQFDSKNVQKDLTKSIDKMLINNERSFKKENPILIHPESRSFHNFYANKSNSVQSSYGNEPSLIRMLKS